jgi:uncharacterized membrane protein YjjP (DUF1212 family)
MEVTSMDYKRWTSVISISSVIVFFIWGWIDTFQRSWLIFMVAGLAMAVLRAMDKKDSDKK